MDPLKLSWICALNTLNSLKSIIFITTLKRDFFVKFPIWRVCLFGWKRIFGKYFSYFPLFGCQLIWENNFWQKISYTDRRKITSLSIIVKLFSFHKSSLLFTASSKEPSIKDQSLLRQWWQTISSDISSANKSLLRRQHLQLRQRPTVWVFTFCGKNYLWILVYTA